MSPFRIYFVLVGLLISSSVFAEDVDQNTEANTLDRVHSSVSHAVLSTARWLDEGLSEDPEAQTSPNKTRMTIESKSIVESGQGLENSFGIRASVDLPNTKREAKLFIETYSEDDFSLKEQELNSETGLDDVERESTRIGLSWWNDKSYGWSRKLKVGMSFSWPLNPYVRAEFKRDIDFDNPWRGYFKQSFSFYHEEGFRSDAKLAFRRPIDDIKSFGLTTRGRYDDDDNEFELSQSAVIYHPLSARRELRYKTGIIATNRPSWGRKVVFIGVDYEHTFYRDWITMIWTPELKAHEENDYHFKPALTARLKMTFSEL